MVVPTAELEFLHPRRPECSPNEVVLTTVKQARNDDHPHYLNVAGGAAGAMGFGDAAIDSVLHRQGVGATSIARVYPPRAAVEGLRSTPGSTEPPTISADYADDEDDCGLARTYRIRFERQVEIPHLCRELVDLKAVEAVTPNYLYSVQVRPDDVFFGLLWGLQAMDCEAAWDLETGHPDLIVAVVDSGVDLGHEDLASKLVGGADFVDVFQGAFGDRFALLGDYRFRDFFPRDEDGHGTHVAGTAGAAGNNGEGVTGVCWGGRILPVRVMAYAFDRFRADTTSIGTTVDIGAGIKFAVDSGAHVVNLSLGGANLSHAAVLDYARDRNVCVVAATGNDNTSDASYPASNSTVLAVGAIDQSFNRASFSNYGPAYNRFVVAPGVRVGSTYRNNGYVYLNGTSMATPHVSGVAGLMISMALRAGATLPVDTVYEIIRTTTTPLTPQLFFGEGLVNAAAALAATRERLA